MKVPLCLSRGGLVEVGLGKKNFERDSWSGSGLKKEGAGMGKRPEEDEGTIRRLIYVRTLSSFLFNATYPSLLPSKFFFTDLIWKFIVARQLRFMVFIQSKRKPKYPS
jgi:hypothetical protein